MVESVRKVDLVNLEEMFEKNMERITNFIQNLEGKIRKGGDVA